MVTGVDLVRAQIRVAGGAPLRRPRPARQETIQRSGFAIQCRVTTEDPANDFVPDYGRLVAYRPPGGAGIRLDAGTAFAGAVIIARSTTRCW